MLYQVKCHLKLYWPLPKTFAKQQPIHSHILAKRSQYRSKYQHKCLTNCSDTSILVISEKSAAGLPRCRISIIVLDSNCFKCCINRFSDNGCIGFDTVSVVFFNARASVLRNFDHCLSFDVGSGVFTSADAFSINAHTQLRVNWKRIHRISKSVLQQTNWREYGPRKYILTTSTIQIGVKNTQTTAGPLKLN